MFYMSLVGYSLGKEKALFVSLSFKAEGTFLEPRLPFETGSFSLFPPSGSSFLPIVNRAAVGAVAAKQDELGRERTLLFSPDGKPSKLN